MRFTSGLPETLCGAGSTLAETEHLRSQLRWVLQGLDVKRLLDAPCGDCNWISKVDLAGIEYIGADNSAANIEAARNKADRDFRLLDVIADDLPKADAMLCRDFYQHLPDRMIISALRNFVASGISWLLATTHDNAVNEDIAQPGMFRRVNLCLPPFYFPDPVEVIADPPGSGHFIGVWQRMDVARAIRLP